MAKRVVASIFVVMLLGAAVVAADQSRSYEWPLEVTWDEAVKAVRDAELYLSSSKRSDHWFLMRTKKKGGVEIRVTLSGTHQAATVEVRAADPADAKKAAKHVDRFLAALDRRMEQMGW